MGSMRLQLWIQLQRDASAIIPRSYFSNYKCLSDEAKMATMRAEVEMRKTRVHTGFHEDAERKRRLRHSERAHSRPNNPETWAKADQNFARVISGTYGHTQTA